MATEKRLIDAIALISKARRMETTDNNGIPVDTYAVSVLAIEDAPTVDAVEVVRCKDCKHRKKWTTTGQFCCFHETSGMAVGVDLRDDDFCSYGERKDDA